RQGQATIYDPVWDRVIFFGGDYTNEVWALSLGDSIWQQINPAGVTPSGRDGAAAVYDPVRDRMIVMGGTDGFIFAGNCCIGELYERHYPSDTWALSLGGSPTWSLLAHDSLGFAGHSAVYDPVRDRVLVFGGLAVSSDCCPQYPCSDYCTQVSYQRFDAVWQLQLRGAAAG